MNRVQYPLFLSRVPPTLVFDECFAVCIDFLATTEKPDHVQKPVNSHYLALHSSKFMTCCPVVPHFNLSKQLLSFLTSIHQPICHYPISLLLPALETQMCRNYPLPFQLCCNPLPTPIYLNLGLLIPIFILF